MSRDGVGVWLGDRAQQFVMLSSSDFSPKILQKFSSLLILIPAVLQPHAGFYLLPTLSPNPSASNSAKSEAVDDFHLWAEGNSSHRAGAEAVQVVPPWDTLKNGAWLHQSAQKCLSCHVLLTGFHGSPSQSLFSWQYTCICETHFFHCQYSCKMCFPTWLPKKVQTNKQTKQ